MGRQAQIGQVGRQLLPGGRQGEVPWVPQAGAHSWGPQLPICHLFPGPGDPRVQQQLQAGAVEGSGRLDCNEDIVQPQLGGQRAWRAQPGGLPHTLWGQARVVP